MKIEEIKLGQRVRVPASEKKGGGNHFAYVTEITKGFEGEDLIIIYIPCLGIEKTADPKLLIK